MIVETRIVYGNVNEVQIDEVFNQLYESNKPTIPIMGETLRKLDSGLWEYVENRIATAEDPEQDIRFLLDELYASIVLSFDKYKDKLIVYQYIPLILQYITQITTNIKSTDSYKIVYNLKPFHTEILDLARNKIDIDDKFNALLLNDSYDVMYLLMMADLLHMSDQALFTFTPKADSSSLSLASFFMPNMRVFMEDKLREGIKMIFHFIRPCLTLQIISDVISSNYLCQELTTQISMFSSQSSKWNLNKNNELSIGDNFDIKLSGESV